MKISPMPALSNTVAGVDAGSPVSSAVEKMRSLKMNTNATPGPAGPPPEIVRAEQELPISDNNVSKVDDAVTQPLSPQFAELARRRRSLQVKERELADREKALADKSQDVNYIERARLKSQPLKVLTEELGVTYDQLTEEILRGQEAGLSSQQVEEIIEKRLEKKLAEQSSASEQQVLAEMRREAQQLSAQGDTYELVRETKSIPHVMQLIERTYRETGEVLDTTEALKLVEDELVSRYKRLSNLQKLQSQNPPLQPPQPQLRQPGMRTLTNKDNASVPLSPKARALAAFYGTLKK